MEFFRIFLPVLAALIVFATIDGLIDRFVIYPLRRRRARQDVTDVVNATIRRISKKDSEEIVSTVNQKVHERIKENQFKSGEEANPD